VRGAGNSRLQDVEAGSLLFQVASANKNVGRDANYPMQRQNLDHYGGVKCI